MSFCINPYSGKTFLGFFQVLFSRIASLVTGKLSLVDMVSDEVQAFVLVSIAISSALLGCFLLLRKTTMLANALSHTVLLGIVLSVILFSSHSLELTSVMPMKILITAALISSLLTIALTEFFMQGFKVQEDASIGIVFTSLFALGVILSTLFTRNVHIGTEAVMGDVDILQFSDLPMGWLIALVNVVVIFLLYKEYTITTFDPEYAESLGIKPKLYHYILMVQTALTIVFAFRAVGVVMVLAFLTIPAVMARLCTHSLKKMIGLALLFGTSGSIMGVALSRHVLSTKGMALSTGGVVVMTLGLLLFALLLLKAAKEFFRGVRKPCSDTNRLEI
jgi:manganese/zinc/iron transport system permease protein